MTIIHHPDDATLMSYSAGSLGEPLSAVVAAHIDMCPRCAAEARRMDRLGAALFEAVKPAELVRRVPTPLQGMDDRGRAPASAGICDDGDVPRPLRRHLGGDLDRIAWKRLGIGLWHYPLPLSKGAKGDLRLLKVSAGQAMPEHGHGGAELTLLLRGSYSDEIGTYRTGDVADLDDEVEHRPIADAQDGCICLIASEEKARFRGLVARLVQPLTGL